MEIVEMLCFVVQQFEEHVSFSLFKPRVLLHRHHDEHHHELKHQQNSVLELQENLDRLHDRRAPWNPFDLGAGRCSVAHGRGATVVMNFIRIAVEFKSLKTDKNHQPKT